MEKENEYEEMRELLQHSLARTAPAGLEQKIMKEVVAFDNKRFGQRQALASWLRFVAVGLVVILLARVVGSQLSWNFTGKLTASDVAGWAEKSGDAGKWLMEHIYYLFPLGLLLFRRRVRDQNV